MTKIELLERETQLDELAARFAAAADRTGQVVFLGGEAGSGKTSLVGAFTATLPKGVTVRSASCDAAGIHGPLGPILDIADTFGPQVAAAVEHDAGVGGVARPILGELRVATEANVLVAEDVHWADQATIDLLRFLARRIERTQTLLIATFRDDSLEPAHELRILLGDLANQANVSRMSLEPLSLEAVVDLTADTGLDPQAVFDSTGGNPFFVAEIVSSRSHTTPRTVRDVVLARAARLDPESRAAIECAAVAGPTIDLPLLRSVSGRDIAIELERCLHVGLLRSTTDGIVFRHALTRDVLLEEMSPVRRRAIARRLLQSLETESGQPSKAALLAHFAEEALDPEAARNYAIAAASEAARLGAHRQAASQYSRALRFSVGMPEAEIAALLEARSFELHVTSQNELALADISGAIEIRQAQGETRRLGDDLRIRSRYFWIEGRNAEAESDARAALDALEVGEPMIERAMAYSNLAQLLMLSRKHADAITWGNRAIDLATALDAPRVTVHAMTNVGTALIMRDGSGWAMLDEAERIARRMGLHEDVGRIYSNRTYSALEQHQLERARSFARSGIAYTDEHDILSMGHYVKALLATARLEAGEFAEAEQEFHRLLEIPNLMPPTRILALTGLGLLHARHGKDSEAILDSAQSSSSCVGSQTFVTVLHAAQSASNPRSTHSLSKQHPEVGS